MAVECFDFSMLNDYLQLLFPILGEAYIERVKPVGGFPNGETTMKQNQSFENAVFVIEPFNVVCHETSLVFCESTQELLVCFGGVQLSEVEVFRLLWLDQEHRDRKIVFFEEEIMKCWCNDIYYN